MGYFLDTVSFIFLHGFLGLPSDWDQTAIYLQKQIKAQITTPDYFSEPKISPQVKLENWSHNFSWWVKEKIGPGPHTLVGYSLGGRLALHALKEYPTLFQSGACISTNPGLPSMIDRSSRLESDKNWSERFTNTPWTEALSDWHSQEIFKGSIQEPIRKESDYKREQLSAALTQWSLGQHTDFREYLQNPHQKINWIVGENDFRYKQMATEMKQILPKLKYHFVPQSGHRVLLDAPEKLALILRTVSGV